MEETTKTAIETTADAAATATTAAEPTFQISLSALQEITTSSINLMGVSFILGSLTTVLLLLLLDYMRSRREAKKA